MNYKFVVKGVISALLLFFLLKDVDFSNIWSSIKNANYILLLFAFLLHFIGLLISSLRWQILLRAQKIRLELKYLYNSYIVASFFNHFFPSTVGGDSIRAYDSWKKGKNKERALAAVMLDRFLGLLTLIIFALISLLFSPALSDKIPGITFWIIILAIGAVVISYFILAPPIEFFAVIEQKKKGIISKIAGIIYKIDTAFSQFSNKKAKLFYSFLLSVLLQLNVIYFYYLISESMNLNISFIDYFLIVPLTIFITMIPISVNGIGLREAALFLFLSQFGVLKSEAIAFAWIEYSMLLILGAIGGIVYTLRK